MRSDISLLSNFMNGREYYTVYFSLDGQWRRLFTVTNIGTESVPEFKFSGFSNNYYSIPTLEKHAPGIISCTEFQNSYNTHNIELTYHKDGAMMTKIKYKDGKDFRHNPYGKDSVWIPVNDISEVQPIFIINLKAPELCTLINPKQENNRRHNYLIKNEELFLINRGCFVLVYIKKKDKRMLRTTSSNLYSDIVCSINKELDLCVYINATDFDREKASKDIIIMGDRVFFSRVYNSYTFCDKEAINEFIKKKMDFVFDEHLCDSVKKLWGDSLWEMTDDNIQKLKDSENNLNHKGNDNIYLLKCWRFLSYFSKLFHIR